MSSPPGSPVLGEQNGSNVVHGSKSTQSVLIAPKSSSTKDIEDQVVKRYNTIGKSSGDKRNYRGLELKNRLKILLISDPTTDISAAAMSVNIGSMSDPHELQGLAHFCEHMLFMGTEKYPVENEYWKFLAENGGTSNAFTDVDQTCYYFDVVPEKLSTTLDIFAQFFITPKFTSSATERELNAVDSEHAKNLCDDSWRLIQLRRFTCNPNHPFSQFGTGNKHTLETIPKQKGIDVRKALLEFHHKWYSSNIMALCVLGKESLDVLEQIVVELFSGVKYRNVTAPRWEEHPCTKNSQGVRITVMPIKDERNLKIVFPVPDTTEHYKSCPSFYPTVLLGHCGRGSLLSALKKRGWCNGLSAGCERGARGFQFFEVRVDLTEQGILHIDDIITLVFQYINLLKKLGPQKIYFDEYRDIWSMNLRFKDKETPICYVGDQVQSIQDYPMEDVLTACYLVTEWRPDLIKEVLTLLEPERMRVYVVGKLFEPLCDQTEKWYGTKYKLEKISQEAMEKWKNAGLCDELCLPEPNDFIPDSFDLVPQDPKAPEYPTIIKDTPFMRVWYKQDDEFFLPKLNTFIAFHSPLAKSDPLSDNLNNVFSSLFSDALVEYMYAAEEAGINFNFESFSSGFIIYLTGYDSKQHLLLNKIMECLTSFKVDPKRFQVMKEILIRNFHNFKAEQPSVQGLDQLITLIFQNVWTNKDLQEAAQTITVEKLEDFIHRFLSSVHVECFIHGNVTKERALYLSSLVEDKLPKNGQPLQPKHLLLDRVIQLEKGSHYRIEIDHTVHKNSSTTLYYQCGLESTQSKMLLELLLQIISEPCFDIIRTKEQLGYSVLSEVQTANGVQALKITVQSDRHPAYVESRVEAFLSHMKKHIETMEDAELENHRESLAAKLLEKPKRLYSKSCMLWAEITCQQYHFGRTAVEVKALRQITRAQLLDFYKENIDIHSKSRQKLGVHVISSAEGGAGHSVVAEKAKDSETESNDKGDTIELLPVPEDTTEVKKIEDIITFKSGQSLYPHITPYMSIPRKGAHWEQTKDTQTACNEPSSQ